MGEKGVLLEEIRTETFAEEHDNDDDDTMMVMMMMFMMIMMMTLMGGERVFCWRKLEPRLLQTDQISLHCIALHAIALMH